MQSNSVDTLQWASESVKAVAFGFMTDADIRKHSVVKINKAILLDNIDKPVPGGLYDPAMGPLDDEAACKSCAQRSFYCPGHFGHIDLVSPVYNPLLFNILYTLLQRTCFFCHHFRASREQVEKCITQLKLIAKGDVVGAKMLDSDLSIELNPERSNGGHSLGPEHMRKGEWTSLQYTEAMSVLNNFLKPKHKGCKNCEAKNPKISKPTFGWLDMHGMSGAVNRANVIRDCKLRDEYTSGADGKSSLEEENTLPWGDDVSAEDTVINSPTRKFGELPAEFIKQSNYFSGPLLPSEVKDIIKLLWENEAQLCSFISDIQCQGYGKEVGHSMFFLQSILVPPIKFRPPSKGGDQVMENSQTVQLTKVLQSNISLGNAHINNSKHSDIVYRWRELQQSINMLFDSKTATGQQKDVGVGICQLLDKKEGLFRQKMMGKRVNFACRSVISPDPYLAVNEIGIPPYFASRLTYPERATPWNVSKLRHAIINGPDTHPGATHYIDKSITMKLIPNRKSRITISRKLPSSRGLFQDHGMGSEYEFEGKTVNRHLQDGDIVLVNRQPTLHKPSIMAHVVRVLKGEKTIRMHYANCSTYNADFDGDEMNVHFPQDEISRAEAYNIVNANNQYVKPTSGEPIRALIQDHIISAVLLTKKDTFLSREEFNQLLFSTGVSAAATNSSSGKSLRKVFTLNSGDEVEPPLPAIWKPEPLWTGKQVITALLNYITRGFNPFTVEKDAKIRRGFFKSRSGKDQAKDREGSVIEKLKEYPDEDNLMIYKNDLVRGVIDKAQFGDYGLVHTVHELYGSNTAGLLLSVLSRLFTVYLQMHGFTCGVDDLLLMKSNDMEREKQLKICEDIGEKVHREFLKLKDDEELDPMALQYNIEKTIRDNGESALTSLDRRMTSQLNERTGNSVVLKDLLSVGLLKPSFYNCISLMTTSGAKGGTANFQQISSHLGQQQLEGKRVPRMVSGKTLPCFLPWDWASRAGGFIVDRFLTGLHPQEYYFHCMAGREGLVDTAVKTSRSGYLQRCLIKNLESLKVCYDYTVRDSDGSIVQFRYGEDGIDVHRTAFIEKFDALAANQETIYKNSHHQLDKSSPYIQELLSSLRKNVRSKDYSSFNQKTQKLLKQDKFFKLLEHKYLSSLAQPGEPVGVLAAQSIGEPSTQMTLNTFHHAGRGEMNVTLGIPRLQEILMTASRDIQTPIMTCPLREGYSMDDAKHLADKLKKVTIADIIEIMKVTVVPFSVVDKDICSIYKLEMKLYPLEDNPKHSHVSTDDLEETLGTLFVRALEDAIQNEMLLLSRINGIKFFMPESQSQASNETDEDISSSKSQPEGNKNEDDDDDGRNDNEDGGGAEDLDFDSKKQKLQGTDEMDYEDDGDDEESNPLETSENESEVDQADNKVENANDKVENANNEAENTDIEVDHISKKTKKSKVEGKKKKVKGERVIKEFDRAIFVKAKGEHFEAHFKFPNDPHILLTQLAQKTAKRVYIQSSGKVDQCQQITCKESQVIYHGHDNPKARKEMKPDEKEKIPALQTTGIDFTTMWDLQDELDVRCIYSNNIHAMLVNYGVEAARETIIREVRNIFNSYGISVNFRHLSLIADFMTHTGGYRAMSRLGGIAEFISPLSKMCFETASKFIVEAAYHGEVDDLETPSARICLGLPVKMGTGSFDLMQKLQG